MLFHNNYFEILYLFNCLLYLLHNYLFEMCTIEYKYKYLF